MLNKNTENTQISVIEFLSSPTVKLTGVLTIVLTALVSFGMINMNTGLYIMAFLVLADMLISPAVIVKVNKSGNYQYLLEDLHKFVHLSFLVFVGVSFIDQIVLSLVGKIVFTLATMFVLDYNFDITSLVADDDAGETDEGYTKEGLALLETIQEDENKKKEQSSTFVRILTAYKAYKFKLKFSFGVLRDVVTGNTKDLKFTEDLNKAFGLDQVASNLSFKAKVKMYYKRYLADAVAVVLIAIVLF